MIPCLYMQTRSPSQTSTSAVPTPAVERAIPSELDWYVFAHLIEEKIIISNEASWYVQSTFYKRTN